MGLGFLVPAFLVGLAAIAIPVIVHLLNRERKEIVRFPSLMFLERIPYRAIRRQTIRHPLLLALRALAVLLLVAAFARPFFERKNIAGPAGAGGTELVILLDRSYSMGYGDRWRRATSAVRSELAGLNPADRVTLIAFDERAAIVAGPTADGAGLASAMDSLRPGDRTTRLGPALATAREVFAGSALPRKSLVLVGDLQRSAWEGGSEGRLPANIETRVVAVSDSAAANAMIARVEVDPVERNGQALGTIVAQVRNQESRTVTRRATLLVQGREVETKPVELGAQGIAAVRFTPVAVPPNAVPATVRLDPDPLQPDDVFNFTLSRDQSLPILVLSRSPANRSVFLRRALALGREPPFDLTIQSPDAVTPSSLDRYAVVVLNNVTFPGGALGSRLVERVQAGAGLIVVAGEANDLSRWNQNGTTLLPVTARGVVDRTSERGGRIGAVQRSHRIFQPFSTPRSGDFSATRFFRYRNLVPRDSAVALAWLDDGTAALVEGHFGNGRVVVWGSTLDDFWNDLVLQPMFLPFLHSMVRYAAGYTPEPAWRTVGQSLGVGPGRDSTTRGEILVLPGGARRRIDAEVKQVELDQPGFFQVETRRREATRLIAVNVDRNESDLTAWNPDELKAAITGSDTLNLVAPTETLTATEREASQRVWWFLLVAAGALLLTEIVVANRMSLARTVTYD
jgi:hypothetical protein